VCRGQGSSPPERECRASGSVRRVPGNEHPYRNPPDAGALFLEAAGKADPFVLHRPAMAIHVVEADRRPELGRDQPADRGSNASGTDCSVARRWAMASAM
jgi:hypothetical protein